MHSRAICEFKNTQDEDDSDEQVILLGNTDNPMDYVTFDIHDADTFTTPYSFWAQLLSYWPALITLLLSLYASMPVLSLGLGFISNTSPVDFSWAWWSDLSTQTKILSVSNAFIAFTVATLTRYRYFPDVAKKLLTIFMNCCASLCSFINLQLILLLSLAAAIAAGALGYDSFIWGGELLAIAAALANFMTVGGFRVTFVSSLFARIAKRFDEDYGFQQRCIEILSKLKKEYAQAFDSLFKGQELNEQTVRELLIKLHEKAQEMEANQAGDSLRLFKAPSRSRQFKYYASTVFDYTFATYLGSCFGDYFAKYGPHGIGIICQQFNPDCDVESWSSLSQIILAILTSLSSGVLGFLTGLDFRQFLAYTYQRIRENPRDILLLGGALICSGIAATPTFVAALAVATHSNYVAMLAFVFANVLLDWMFNFRASVEILMRPTLLATVNNGKLWLQKYELPKETVKELKKFSLFAVKPRPKPTHKELKILCTMPSYSQV